MKNMGFMSFLTFYTEQGLSLPCIQLYVGKLAEKDQSAVGEGYTNPLHYLADRCLVGRSWLQ